MLFDCSGARAEAEAVDERDLGVGLADEDHRHVVVRLVLDVHSGGPKCKSTIRLFRSIPMLSVAFSSRSDLATTLFWRLFRNIGDAFFTRGLVRLGDATN